MNKFRTAAMLAAILIAGPAMAADVFTVDALRKECAADSTSCTMFVLGAVVGIRSTMDMFQLNQDAACSFQGNAGAWVKAFQNWSDNHPEEWSWPAEVGVWNSMNATWGCPLNRAKFTPKEN